MQEIEVLGLAVATLVSKYHKIATIDELLDRLFFLGKAAIAVLLYFVGVRHFLSYIILGTGTCVCGAAAFQEQCTGVNGRSSACVVRARLLLSMTGLLVTRHMPSSLQQVPAFFAFFVNLGTSIS